MLIFQVVCITRDKLEGLTLSLPHWLEVLCRFGSFRTPYQVYSVYQLK